MQENLTLENNGTDNDNSATGTSVPSNVSQATEYNNQSVLSLLQIERDYLLTKFERLEALDRQVTALSSELAARDRAYLTLDATLLTRTHQLDLQSNEVARAREQAEQEIRNVRGNAELELIRVRENTEVVLRHARHLEAEFERLSALKDDLNHRYQLILASRTWRATGSLRRMASSLTPHQRLMLRRVLKMVYWVVTPQRTAERIRFLMARRDALRHPAPVYVTPEEQAPATTPVTAAANAPVGVVQPQRVARDAANWFYIGDTLEWLATHDQLTGVGKVTSELLTASCDAATGTHARLCLMGESESGLVEAPYAETVELLAAKLGKTELSAALPQDRGQSKAWVPQPGDSVLFTGVVWTPHYKQMFERLAGQGIGVNVFLYDIIPVEHPELVGEAHYQMFIVWLETVVEYAQTLFVSSRSIQDKLVRWATLMGVPVNARIVIVDFGANPDEAFASREALATHQATARVDLTSFVLSVGTIDKRKNQSLLARLWVRLVAELGADRVPQLVLVGRDDIRLPELNEGVAALVASSKILVLQGLSDLELVGLYRTCLFTAFASFSEGYGLPVAESLRYGKVCVSSDLECIREHAGNFPWYFEPREEENAYRLLKLAIEGGSERASAEHYITQHYRARTWRESWETISHAVGESVPPVRAGITAFERPVFPGARPVDLPLALEKAGKWCTTVLPDVSMLIINWNAGALTLECIRQIWANTDGFRYEIVIVDNGSREEHLAPLRHLGSGIKVLELGKNRFFGEANNIAAEAATGRYLCLQNNDAFVQPGWLTSLISVFKQNPEVGAAGPLFLFPDLSIQEAGAVINEGGYPIRFGRGQAITQTEFLKPLSVDYISAANLIVPRDLFMQVGGFDLQYEPAYYEDVDLCFKIRAMGRSIHYCPDARVIHIEGSAANNNPEAEARRNALGDLNRDKFTSRWGNFLKSRSVRDLESVRRSFISVLPAGTTPLVQRVAPSQTAVIYTPYALTPGGGERYIMTMAAVLAERYQVTVVTPHPYSNLRLRNLECEFEIDLSACRLATTDAFLAAPKPDLMITMGNHIVPPVEARGRVSVFLCQFPFKMPDPVEAMSNMLDGYHSIIAYSEYSKAHIYASLSASQLPPRPINVVNPPVQLQRGDPMIKKRMILSVGRFFIGAHSKRQDLLISAFRTLHERVGGGIELHLAGSSIPEPVHMDYLNRLRSMAQGLPVKFHVNVSQTDLAALYRDAAVYWHGAGLESNLDERPETAEHFGMTIVEAMSAGCVPLSFNAGGPRETITGGVDGFLYGTLDSLISTTQHLFADYSRDMRERMGLRAATRALDFSLERFVEGVYGLVDESVVASEASAEDVL